MHIESKDLPSLNLSASRRALHGAVDLCALRFHWVAYVADVFVCVEAFRLQRTPSEERSCNGQNCRSEYTHFRQRLSGTQPQ